MTGEGNSLTKACKNKNCNRYVTNYLCALPRNLTRFGPQGGGCSILHTK